MRFIRAIIGAVLLSAALLYSPSHAIQGFNGYAGPYVDVRAYGAACDGSSDDKDEFNQAYTALNTAGGGTIIVPGGKTCKLSSDVIMRSNVNLLCEPGSVLSADASGTFTIAMFSAFLVDPLQLTADNMVISGCNFDLNGKKVALLTSGDNIRVSNNKFYDGDTSEASDWSLVKFGCNGNCEFTKNQIECANSSSANDIGVDITGVSADGKIALISNNQVLNCDSYGIKSSSVASITNNAVTALGVGIYQNAGDSTVTGNRVEVSGSSGIGIQMAAQYTSAVNNKVEMTGESGIGILLSAANTQALENRLIIAGATGVAIKATENTHVINSNIYTLTSDSDGTDSAIGIYAGDGGVFDWYYTINGNIGSVNTTDSQVHVHLAAALSSISGNLFTKGKYGIAPSQVSADEFGIAFNSNITGNRFYSQGTTGIIATTGFIITGNYIAWLGAGATAAIELGDDRTYKAGTSHTNITGNLIHTSQTGAVAIKANEIEKTCDSGSRKSMACTTDDTNGTTGCPGATCPGCCDTAVGISGIQVVGNHILWAAPDHGTAIDLTGVSSASGNIYNWVIDGNTLENNDTEGDSLAIIKCSASNQSKVFGIEVGTNSYSGYAPTAATTTEGRIDLNCTPDMVNDLNTSLIWLPAAGCNGTTGYPAYDLPTSNAPTALCIGSNTPRGVLSFPNLSDTASYVLLDLPGQDQYQFFVRPIYTVTVANTLSTRWGFTLKCQGDANDTDTSWTETESTLDTAFGNLASDFEIPSSYSTLGGAVCGGKMATFRIRRIGSNSTTGQDDQTNSSLLIGVEVWARKQS